MTDNLEKRVIVVLVSRGKTLPIEGLVLMANVLSLLGNSQSDLLTSPSGVASKNC